jgi:hypothetical protein
MQQCHAMKTDGERCTRRQEGKYCHQHIPKDIDMEGNTEINTAINMNTVTIMGKEELEHLVYQLENKLKLVKKKVRMFDHNKLHQKALRIYYHENKKQDDVLNIVRQNLNSTGMLRYKVNAKGERKEIIPWQLVFECTTDMFDRLDASVKETYYERARAG